MIPKIIQTVWIGKNPVPAEHQKNWDNTRKILHDYEPILWNDELLEKNLFNHSLYPFIMRAINERKFAFASDAIKLAALEIHGGWVMDMDNEILDRLDQFHEYNWVSGFESYRRHTPKPITAVWGAIPNHPFTKKLIKEIYLEKDFDKVVSIPNTGFITDILTDNGVKKNNTEQYLKNIDVKLYPYHVFCTPEHGKKSYAIHKFAKSWGT